MTATEAAIITAAVFAYLVFHIVLRRVLGRMWREGRIRGWRAALALYAISYGPILIAAIWLVAMDAFTTALVLIIVSLPLLFSVVVFEHAERIGVREHMARVAKRARESETPAGDADRR